MCMRNLLIVAILCLVLFGGCSKESALPACENGSCCWEGTGPEFVRRLDDARAEYGGSAFLLREPISIIDGYESHSALVCQVQGDMLREKNLFNNATVVDNKVRLVDSTRIYPYRVWGIIYNLKNVIGIIPKRPTYALYIERIEEVKQ